MAITTPPRSAHRTEPPIRANLERHHIHQASPRTHKHLQHLLHLSIVWASLRSTSNTKTLPNTAAAMNSLLRILAVAVWAAKSTASTICTSIASALLLIKAPISLSHPLLLVSNESEAYHILTVFVTREPPQSSNQCPH